MLFVHDLERAKTFYRDVLQLEPEEQEEGFASYRAGAVSLQLHPAGEPHPGVVLGRSGTGVPVQITFEVDNVDAAIDHVRQLGFEVFDEPKDRPWGKRDAGIFDPEGNEIYFSQPVK
jgi:predicted enzyme related to lactoylglutathione lyase